MTENESEKLYEDLRRKLADYGSAPPEAVWAGIRQQVPAQKQTHWKRSALLLLLLCLPALVLTLGPRPWRQRLGLGHSSSTQTTSQATTPTLASNRVGTASLPNNAALPPDASAQQSGLTNEPATTGLAQPSSSLSSGVVPAGGAPSRVAAGMLGHPKSSELRRQRSVGSETVVATAKPRRKRHEALALLAPSLHTKQNTLALRRRAKFAPKGSAYAATVEGKPLGTQPSTRTGKGHRAKFPVGAGAELADNSGEGLARRFSNERLTLLAVRPTLAEAQEPEVRRVKRTRPHRSRQAQLLKGWSVQVLAGSSLTHRTLTDSARQLERLERPSIGYSGQITASYALNKRLTISTGLGYAEYANNLHYQLQKTSSETSRVIDFRDVYRFVSIPLLAQYTLGGNQRWRFGTLGGANLGLLTSTRTTQGSPCNCNQTTAPAAGTYRNTNLILTAGGFLSYQFAPGQWLTLRPQGQYFLNSLTDPAMGKAARHPWSLGVQGGFSFDLEPKK